MVVASLNLAHDERICKWRLLIKEPIGAMVLGHFLSLRKCVMFSKKHVEVDMVFWRVDSMRFLGNHWWLLGGGEGGVANGVVIRGGQGR